MALEKPWVLHANTLQGQGTQQKMVLQTFVYPTSIKLEENNFLLWCHQVVAIIHRDYNFQKYILDP